MMEKHILTHEEAILIRAALLQEIKGTEEVLRALKTKLAILEKAYKIREKNVKKNP